MVVNCNVIYYIAVLDYDAFCVAQKLRKDAESKINKTFLRKILNTSLLSHIYKLLKKNSFYKRFSNGRDTC